MLEIKVNKKDKHKIVTFVTPGTYVNGENFAKAASRGVFEKVKKAKSRSDFYLATAVAVMLAIGDGIKNSYLSYGRYYGEYAAWVEVDFDGKLYIINPVESRDILIPEKELRQLLSSQSLEAKWSCNFHEIRRNPAAEELMEAMKDRETSRNIIPVIAAAKFFD